MEGQIPADPDGAGTRAERRRAAREQNRPHYDVLTGPRSGREHELTRDCWCQPRAIPVKPSGSLSGKAAEIQEIAVRADHIAAAATRTAHRD